MSKKVDVYQMVTDRIINQLEKGIIPWHRPWIMIKDGAFNRVTKRPYSMLNQMILEHKGEYATFKQWSELGGKIKKGAKSEFVVFWKIYGKENNEDEDAKVFPILRFYKVFHISQAEGVEPLPKQEYNHKPLEEAERFANDYIEREGIILDVCDSNKAFYRPASDMIVVPDKKQFEYIEEYYGTLFHEIVHSTGSKNRLNRLNGVAWAGFGSDDYSKEELVAEIGSSAIMNMLGLENVNTFQNTIAYIQSWLKVLKGDNHFIVSASSMAEKAVNFIKGNTDQ